MNFKHKYLHTFVLKYKSQLGMLREQLNSSCWVASSCGAFSKEILTFLTKMISIQNCFYLLFLLCFFQHSNKSMLYI